MNEPRRLNPDYLSKVFRHVNTCPYFGLLSIELKSLEWGRSYLEVEIQEKHMQPYGMVHGGVHASIVDAACFWALWTQVDGDVGLTTVEMKLNYLAPVKEGRMIAKGKSIRIGRTLGLAEAFVVDHKGGLVAHGTSTLMVLRDLKIPGQERIGPKFL